MKNISLVVAIMLFLSSCTMGNGDDKNEKKSTQKECVGVKESDVTVKLLKTGALISARDYSHVNFKPGDSVCVCKIINSKHVDDSSFKFYIVADGEFTESNDTFIEADSSVTRSEYHIGIIR